MAFMGMIWAGVFLILAIIVIVAIIGTIGTCITLGIVLLINKKKKTAIIPFAIAGAIIAIILIISFVANFASQFHTVEAPDGTSATVSSLIYREYTSALIDFDEESSHLAAREKLINCIKEEPSLVHCEDFRHRKILDYALEYYDVEMTKLAIENGAVIDDYESSPLPYDTSLECLYGGFAGGYRYYEHGLPPFEDMYFLTEYLISNGAKLEWKIQSYDDHPNVLFEAVNYICYDDYVEKEELKLLKLIIDSGCPTDALSNDRDYGRRNYTALELLQKYAVKTEEGIDLYGGNDNIPDWETVFRNIE